MHFAFDNFFKEKTRRYYIIFLEEILPLSINHLFIYLFISPLNFKKYFSLF